VWIEAASDNRRRVGRGTTRAWCPSGRGTTRAEDAQGTPTQSHISPSILVYEDNRRQGAGADGGGAAHVPSSSLLLSSLELSDTQSL